MTGRVLTIAGVAIAAGHALALPWLVERFERPALRVAIDGAASAPGPSMSFATELPRRIADRIEMSRPDPGPGLQHVEWSIRYSGGTERRVGWTQLVGPFQDPARPPCSARLLVGQRLLDDGAAGAGTLAHIVAILAGRQMEGFDAFPVGRFERVGSVRLRWVGPAADRRGHLSVLAHLRFEHADLELAIRIAPRLERGALRLDSTTGARVRLDNRIAQWVSDLIDGDRIAGRMARREISAALDQVLTAPPPLPLGGGRRLELVYCADRDIEIADGAYAAVPLAVVLAPAAVQAITTGRPAAPALLPAASAGSPLQLDAPLAIVLDGYALNGLLYVLWATGFLEEELAASGIVDRFQDDPVVRDLLSVRASRPRLPLPPTVAPARRPGQSYELAIASSILLEDGDQRTPAHLFGRAGFDLDRSGADPARPAAAVALFDLGLTCEPMPGLLEPCYPELAAELIARAPEVHGQLSLWFGDLLAELLVDRDVTPPGSEAGFRVVGARIHSPPRGQHGPLRVDLAGRLEPVE